MAPLQNTEDIRLAIESQAQGKIEEYARNPNLLEKRRRESLNYAPPPDDPEIRYTTASMQALQSTGLSYHVLEREGDVYRDYESVLRRDITFQDVMDYETTSFDSTIRCAQVGKPAARYNTERRLELIRIDSFKEKDKQCIELTRQWLAAMDRSNQEALARHFIRQRWETIGVWNNNQWKLKPSPTTKWEWPWLSARRDTSGILRLTRLALTDCGVMSPGCYGESAEHKASNQTPRGLWSHVEGDEFISSRPWFAFEIECIVEDTRRWMLPAEAKARLPTNASDFIRRQWTKKGIWNDEWSFQGRQQEEAFVGWRWKKETPEPQQADMTELNGKYDMDFTESEEDEMRRIETPGRSRGVSGGARENVQAGGEIEENRPPVPRRSARIAALQERRAAEAARAAQDSQPSPQALPRRRHEGLRPLPTRIQPERRGKGKLRAGNAEDGGVAKKSKGRATKRRRRG